MPTPEAVHLHQSYWTSPAPLAPDHRDGMHKLAVSVNWPHRPEDMAFLLSLGEGYIATDEIGRPLGAGMVFSYGPEMAMIGMMMTHPKLQSGGLGAHILKLLTQQAGTDRLRLNATRSAHRLYRAAGFVETGLVHQYQGVVTTPPRPATDLRPATVDDFPQIAELDRRTFGAARGPVLQSLFDTSDVVVLTDGATVTGYAFCRLFGRGRVIGPMSAPDEDAAAGLAGYFLSKHQGAFMRLDADARHKALETFLNGAGLATYDRIIPMQRGGATGPEGAADKVYALASQALG